MIRSLEALIVLLVKYKRKMISIIWDTYVYGLLYNIIN